MRKVPVKNYFLLILLVGVTVFLTYYCCNLYNEHHENKYTSLLISFLTEIKEDDIENYVLENPTVVLYIGDKTNKAMDETEREFKKYLTDKNIYSYFVYVDISKEKDNSLQSFQENYNLSLNYEQLPILIVFQDGELVDTYNQTEWNMTNVTDFLRRNEVVDCD